MQAYKMKVNVPANHQLALSLPASFPSGPAEMILLAETPKGDRVVRLGGVLAPSQAPAADTDPISMCCRNCVNSARIGSNRPRQAAESKSV